MPWKKSPPKKDYYAVIFSATKSDSLESYEEIDAITMQLASEQEGYLGYENSKNGESGIFISYWESLEAIENWRKHAVHRLAKEKAKDWYVRYLSQICKVESSHLFEKKS